MRKRVPSGLIHRCRYGKASIRGIGTALADVDNALAAKSVLRHSNVATTKAHRVKSIDATDVRAIDKISVLFDNTNGSGRPNKRRGKDESSVTARS